MTGTIRGYATDGTGGSLKRTLNVPGDTVRTRHCAGCGRNVSAKLELGPLNEGEPSPRLVWKCGECDCIIRNARLELDVIGNTLQEVLN